MFVAARVTARLPALDGTFGLDDWFIVAAWVLSMGFTIILNMLSYSGLGKDVWTLRFDNITETLKLFTILEKVYTPTTWFTKISILFLYLRLFPDHELRRTIKIGLGLCAASLVCLELACIFKCWPISYSWTFWDGEHGGKCTSMSGQGWANASVNMFADIAVLILPLPTIWKLKLPIEKKLGIMAMFSVGLFVTVVSMVRLKTMKYFNFSANASWDFVELSLWSAIEIYVGIMCACMPGMRAFYTRVCRGRNWEKTGASHGYPAVSNTHQKSARDTFASSGTGLRDKVHRKGQFELMVTETDSTEDLTHKEEGIQRDF
ncbi:hypothetical protein LTR70_007370 [Exophiala xenobiotica]|uniref:Rhodopsin domain-containing protein n=1 Tax=Lithohypha guttulata TaxID=1690604 RepID=A0ABR0K4G9_9EURO|nr:hypothetical protein LTR24_006901 [Lithohypha guttulata]KAK5314002.1 hypothetical protein LTR70_007370 [Exophiala xenobiotica]